MREVLSEEEVTLLAGKSLPPGREYRVAGYDVVPAGDSQMGFLGDHLNVRVEVTCGTEHLRLSFFAKAVPRAVPRHVDYILSTRAFYKEIQLYKTLLEDARKSRTRTRKWCPRYFYSRDEEVLVVEDLSRDGYRMLPERSIMDEEHVKAALTAVAAMHAGSFVLEEKLATSLGDVYSNLTFETEASDVPGHLGNRFCETGIASQIALVDFLDYAPADKERIRRELPGVLRRMFQLVKPSERYRNVFVHGDLWANNILFREAPRGGAPEAVVIDFQLARYAPPAHDVMMLLHLVQERRFRDRRQDDLLAHYHRALSEELSANGVSVDSVLPLSTFLESCRRYDDLGLISSVLYFQFVMAPPEVAKRFMSSPDMYERVMFVDRSDILRECFVRDDVFRRRMTDALVDVVERFIMAAPSSTSPE